MKYTINQSIINQIHDHFRKSLKICNSVTWDDNKFTPKKKHS